MIFVFFLFQVKHNYRIAPSSSFKEGRSSKVLLTEGGQQEPFRVDRGDINHLNKPQIDADLARMEFMTSQEAAEAAAQAVVEAEVAMFEAEESVQKAEAAEADAEEAGAFAEAAEAILKEKIAAKMVIFLFFCFLISAFLIYFACPSLVKFQQFVVFFQRISNT